MSLINSVFDRQYFEYIRDRIYDILLEELSNKAIIGYDDDLLDTIVSLEDSIAKPQAELNIVNIALGQGVFSNKNQGNQDGAYTFFIDVYAGAKESDSETGTTKSAKKVHRIVGLCRAILETPVYRTLGFTPGFIRRTTCTNIEIGETKNNDTRNVAMARLTFVVEALENSPFKEPRVAQGFETVIKISDSDVGYYIIGY